MRNAPEYYQIEITKIDEDGNYKSFKCDADDIIRALIRHNELSDSMMTPYYYNALKYLMRCGCKEDFDKDIKKSITYLKELIWE